jgi:hypothetical protein
MKSRHISTVSQAPELAQMTTLEIKLQGFTTVTDTLLLVQRAAAWKTFPPGSGGTGGGDGDTGDGVGDGTDGDTGGDVNI